MLKAELVGPYVVLDLGESARTIKTCTVTVHVTGFGNSLLNFARLRMGLGFF